MPDLKYLDITVSVKTVLETVNILVEPDRTACLQAHRVLEVTLKTRAGG